MSIHRPLRNEFAHILASFLNGDINSDEARDLLAVHNNYKDADIDPILGDVFGELDLFFDSPYGPFNTETMTEPIDTAIFLARVACFLKTNLEYDPGLFHIRLLDRMRHPLRTEFEREKKLRYWPFADKEAFDTAWKSCPFGYLVERIARDAELRRMGD